ncbi:MAG: chorismate synthase [Candidatus Omnitrophica bacterium]|nr:chorismate synthase [Candidatus Omnitrophota bacterium]HOX54350.1 chorismate synthase [Candidatus Omnitrophota bacterium]
MLRLLSAGESHGAALLAILEGMPAGLKVDKGFIDQELKRRQSGYGRGPRMKIEQDRVDILSGIARGKTIGSPIALKIDNRDSSIDKLPKVLAPRPGHADLAGALKYDFNDIRFVLERASARETAIRVAAGALCKTFLKEFRIVVSSRLLMVGGESTESRMKQKIDEARQKQDTLGGSFEVVAQGVPVGLGSYVQSDKRLDARLAAVVMSIPGIKAVEIGLGAESANRMGSEVHDEIFYSKSKGFYRKTNNAGGIEGGISNGEPIVVRAYMKPISSLAQPLDSVNIITRKPTKAAIQRADICAVLAAGVIAEGAVAFVLSDAFLEKFGSDSLSQIKRSFQGYINSL